MTETFGKGSPIRVAVAGSTGYAGAGCVALLSRHPDVDLVQLSSRSQAGSAHREVYPGSDCELVMVPELDPSGCDVVVSALPPGEAARSAPQWLSAGATVVDVSADFRLRDPLQYLKWYGEAHPNPDLLSRSVLATPELAPQAIADAELLALPGCFSTAAILACGPALREHLVTSEVLVDAKTGVSGAGRQADHRYLLSEVGESTRAYGVSGHRHQPEMVQALSDLAAEPCKVTFVPHLVPMVRGIVATCYLQLRPGVELQVVREAYQRQYGDQPFIRFSEEPAASKLVSGTNLCYLSLHRQEDHLIVCAVIDNLGRGASSQAVQVLNQRFGFSPTAGLELYPRWP
ncbi:MAG TPA: N-acetyl-gamma-glutamyl-phosphate reductase [Candidatus Dormibacteraeota bacterium]|nr:N-acetyl-gamma-glutamyl-phosphate reductase [Candidatus Dormibacteraeota bacterium]